MFENIEEFFTSNDPEVRKGGLKPTFEIVPKTLGKVLLDKLNTFEGTVDDGVFYLKDPEHPHVEMTLTHGDKFIQIETRSLSILGDDILHVWPGALGNLNKEDAGTVKWWLSENRNGIVVTNPDDPDDVVELDHYKSGNLHITSDVTGTTHGIQATTPNVRKLIRERNDTIEQMFVGTGDFSGFLLGALKETLRLEVFKSLSKHYVFNVDDLVKKVVIRYQFHVLDKFGDLVVVDEPTLEMVGSIIKKVHSVWTNPGESHG